MRLWVCLLVSSFLAVFVSPRPAEANHFEISLTVTDGHNTQSGKTETEPPKAGEKVERPVMQAQFGARCTAAWKIASQNKETLKDVLIHFYVVRIEKQGQAPPPLEPTEVVMETAQSMDFANRTSTSAQLQFVPDRPGIYLVRIETQGTADAKGHEHYAAIDLIVK